jgi:hypothetical protein
VTIPVLSRLARRSRAQVQRDPLFEDVVRVEDDYFRFCSRGAQA